MSSLARFGRCRLGKSIAPSTLIHATWIPFGPRSRANDWANPRFAKLPGPNATDRGPALRPAVAPVKRITPRPRATIAGTHSLAHRKPPIALTRMQLSKIGRAHV